MPPLSKNIAKFRLDYQSPAFFIDTVDLDFDLHKTQTCVIAVSQVRRANINEDIPLELQGKNLILKRIEINGKSYTDYQQKDDCLVIYRVPNSFSLLIETQINPQENTALEGLYYSSNIFCTQCEAEGFRRITFFLDRPDILSRYTTRIEADKAQYPYLLSNGNRIDSGQTDQGRHWVKWQDPFPKPCYLFALVAGEFDLVTDFFVTRSNRKVTLELYVEKGQRHKTQHAMASLKKSMAWDESRFNLEYDLDIFMTVAVDFFNAGAMENKGLNIFNTKYILANPNTATDTDLDSIESVVGHEYFHNWTGNRITCRDWFQLSLKEGLTVFRDQEFSADQGSRGVLRIEQAKCIRNRQFVEDASPMAHPIRPDVVLEMNNFYTCTVYEKGAEVIRMLHRILGEQAFQKGMQYYVKRHDGQAVTCDDFVQAMEDASGINLQLFRKWYAQSGTPQVTIDATYDTQAQTYTVVCHQHTAPTADQNYKEALHIPLQTSLYDAKGQKLCSKVLHLQQENQTFVFENIPEKPIPSFLDDFSAPVKLDFSYSEAQLSLLATCAVDSFSRWDALQTLIGQQFKKAVQANQNFIEDQQLLASVFSNIIQTSFEDLKLQATLLYFPSSKTLLSLFEQVNPLVICDVRNQLVSYLSKALRSQWLSCYDKYLQVKSSASVRALKNLCLYYLCRADSSFEDQVMQAFSQATNMTDQLGAMVAARDANYACYQNMLNEFEQQWSDDVLVMDKWMSMQAAHEVESAFSRVKALCEHPHFSLKNPNRVYSLIRTFTNENTYAFHLENGAGYRFLTTTILDLDAINPHVSSALLTPFLSFQKFDFDRQQKMIGCLQQIADHTPISNNVTEKVNKALEQAGKMVKDEE